MTNDDGILQTDDEDEATKEMRLSVMSIPSDYPIPETAPKTITEDVNFTPYNHFTAEVPKQSSHNYPQFDFSPEVKRKPSMFETLKATAKELSPSYHAMHSLYDNLNQPDSGYDPNFNPLNFEDQIVNMDSKYYPYILSAPNEQQFNFRLNRIKDEQKNNDAIKNGGWTGYLGGAALSFVDPISYIPIIGFAKYATLAKTFAMSAARSFPGAATYAGLSSAAEEEDKINGNFQDGLISTVVKSVFGTALFGGLGVASLTADKSALWGLNSFMADHIEGIGYKLKVDKADKVVGMEAYDMTNGTLSAARVEAAQDKANSTFSKTGLFKVPYLGDAATKFLGNTLFGSSILRLLNSKYETVRVVADLAYDHGIITEGLEKGIPNPDKFFTKMKQTYAGLRTLQAELIGLHVERNGIDLDNYVAQEATRAGLYIKDKASKLMGKDLGEAPYVNEEEFLSEVNTVLYTDNKSPHNAVNEGAEKIRKITDTSYKNWRIANDMPEDWAPPRTAETYASRVYNTPFMNNNENLWIEKISNELKNQDEQILRYQEPIRNVEGLIEKNIKSQKELIDKPNSTTAQKKKLVDELMSLKATKKALEENLQNQIRTNPEFKLIYDDWNALSADEANELIALTKRRDIAEKEVAERKAIIAKIKAEAKKREAASLKNKSIETAKKNKRKSVTGELVLEKEEAKLAEVEKELEEELFKLQELAASGKINRRFYSKAKDSNIYVFRDPGERLKLRDTYHEQKGYRADEEQAHEFRKEHAKYQYNKIMNQTPEDTINQIMGHFTGNGAEKHSLERSILVPDELLYDNNFMSKDLMAKVANYVSWFDRRTHLKNIYRDVTVDGGFEPIFKQLDDQFQANRLILNTNKERIENQLKAENLSDKEKKKLEKELKKADKALRDETIDFNRAKYDLKFIYEKLMGISNLSKKQKAIVSSSRSMTVAVNLQFLPATLVSDLSGNGLKHGVIPWLRSGMVPWITSLGAYLNTKNGIALREGAAAINLASQHLGSATAEKNMGMMTTPYLNMGKIPGYMDKLAHFTSNMAGTNLFENHLQIITVGVAQNQIMNHMFKFKNGTLTASERRWLNRYGLDPERDSEAFINAFKANGGGKTSLGAYQSNYWQWKDMKASNKFGDACFRATHDTIISAHTLDSPMWMDENGSLGIIGPLVKGFHGWTFGSLNRYLIPFLQKPDPQQFAGVLAMIATSALVSPMRRLARGEDPYPKDMTDEQFAYEIFSDTPIMSFFSGLMNDANVLTKGSLLRDLKNDKYRDRTRVGLLGPAWGDLNNMADIIGALASGEMNENDAHKMARMIPPFGLLWTYRMSKALIDNFGLPKTRAIAQRQHG